MTHRKEKVLYDLQHECTMNMQGGSRFWFFQTVLGLRRGVELRIPTGRCGLATSPRCTDAVSVATSHGSDTAQGVQWKELQTLVDSVCNIAQSIKLTGINGINMNQPSFCQKDENIPVR